MESIIESISSRFISASQAPWTEEPTLYCLGSVSPCASQVVPLVKNPSANAVDAGSRPGSGRSSGVGNGNPLQCSCLESPMDSGAWWATAHGITDTAEQHKHTHTQSAIFLSGQD